MLTVSHTKVVVHDPIETLKAMNAGASIGRLGDGEIKLILFTAMRFQEPSEALHLRLLEVLRSNLPGLLVGVPYLTDAQIADLRELADQQMVDRFVSHRARLNAMWDPAKVYHSAFVSRPDAWPITDYTEFFALWRSLWKGRHVVVVEPNVPEYCFNQPGVLTGHASLEQVFVPKKRAFDRYDRILKRCLQFPKDRLFLMAAGPAATILAHDLHAEGYQALDVGHIWRWLRDDPDPIRRPK
ncbi:MAG: DUF1792 domain-containing protein [Caulobacteraceae bacterium]|nr:MAG: DUF1792 domain-containing protein [Caulobacteraceae bacterium]